MIGVGLSLGLLGTAYVGVLMVGFYALKFHVTDVAGVIDPHSDDYGALSRSLLNIPIEQLHLPGVDSRDEGLQKLAAAQDRCQIAVVNAAYPTNGGRLTAALSSGAPHDVLAKMVFAVRLRDSDPAFLMALDGCLNQPESPAVANLTRHSNNVFPWANREEWGVAQAGFTKDKQSIDAAAGSAGVEARMIVAAGFVEQMRLYFTQREVYEKFFKPLQILGTATKFAWGVMAIKEATAIDVERHLTDTRSNFYLGQTKAHALDFTTPDQNGERFTRLTNEKDHRYSYLYGGFELAQFIEQWRRAGFDISRRPEILATLYNIGFSRSKPNANPQVGGSTILIADTNYTFGALAFEFYYSGELTDVFPYTPTRPPTNG